MNYLKEVVIAGIVYLAINENHFAKLSAIQDMEKESVNWKILNPDVIRSISIYVKN